MYRGRPPAPPPPDEVQSYLSAYRNREHRRETCPPQRITWSDILRSAEQKKYWENLQLKIVNTVNYLKEFNIGNARKQLYDLNIVSAKGIFCQNIIQAQKYSTINTYNFAKLASLINLDFPNIGELLLKRCIIQFKYAYRKRNTNEFTASAMFIAHLVNLEVADPCLINEVLRIFITSPDKRAVQIIFMALRICGEKLQSSYKNDMEELLKLIAFVLRRKKVIDDEVRSGLKMIINVYRNGYSDDAYFDKYMICRKQPTHIMSFYLGSHNQYQFVNEKCNDQYSGNILLTEETTQNVLRFADYEDISEADYERNKTLNTFKLKYIVNNILNYSNDPIYSAQEFRKIKPGQEFEFCDIYLELCCGQRRYDESYGCSAKVLCGLNYLIVESFQKIFEKLYLTAHVFLNNKLRNVAKFYAFLLYTQSIPWSILSIINLTGNDTTDNTRLFLKIILNELIRLMGFDGLCVLFQQFDVKSAFKGIFYAETKTKADFIMDFFLSIGLDGLIQEYYTT